MLNMHSQEGEGSTHANKHWLVDAACEQNKKLQNMENIKNHWLKNPKFIISRNTVIKIIQKILNNRKLPA